MTHIYTHSNNDTKVQVRENSISVTCSATTSQCHYCYVKRSCIFAVYKYVCSILLCMGATPLYRSVELYSEWRSLFVCVESGFGRSR